MRKFVKRNRAKVITAGTVGVTLVLGLIGTGLGLHWALAEKAEAGRAQIAAKKVADFMSETLAGVGPSVALGRDTALLEELMATAAARIKRGDLAKSPDAELRLRSTVGFTYSFMGKSDLALGLLKPALALARETHDEDHLSTARASYDLAHLLATRGDLERAEQLAQEAVEMLERLYPDNHMQRAIGLHKQGFVLQTHDRRKARQVLEESLAMQRRLLDGDYEQTARTLNNLAQIVYSLREPVLAEELGKEGG